MVKDETIELSVIIGTCDRPQYLLRALESLLRQNIPTLFEIIVVDNSTNDATEQLVAQKFSKNDCICYTRTKIASGNRARDTGLSMAKGTHVAFLDDDAVADVRWIAEIHNAFVKLGKTAGCIGGPSELLFEAPRPFWLSSWLLPFLGEMNRGKKLMQLGRKDMLFGLNIAFDAAALRESGAYGNFLDRGQMDLLSNSEYPMQAALEHKGFYRYYVPGMCVQHHVPAGRLRLTWMLRRAYWQGVSDARISRVRSLGRRPSFLRVYTPPAHTFGLRLAAVVVPTPKNVVLWTAWICMFAGFISEKWSFRGN